MCDSRELGVVEIVEPQPGPDADESQPEAEPVEAEPAAVGSTTDDHD